MRAHAAAPPPAPCPNSPAADTTAPAHARVRLRSRGRPSSQVQVKSSLPNTVPGATAPRAPSLRRRAIRRPPYTESRRCAAAPTRARPRGLSCGASPTASVHMQMRHAAAITTLQLLLQHADATCSCYHDIEAAPVGWIRTPRASWQRSFVEGEHCGGCAQVASCAGVGGLLRAAAPARGRWRDQGW
jgi:hypothetical protein